VVKVIEEPEYIELIREGDIRFSVLKAYLKDLDT